MTTVYIEDPSVRLLCGKNSDLERLRNACSYGVREVNLAGSRRATNQVLHIRITQASDTRNYSRIRLSSVGFSLALKLVTLVLQVNPGAVVADDRILVIIRD